MEVPSPLVLSEERLPALFMELERIAGLCGEVLAEVRAVCCSGTVIRTSRRSVRPRL